MLSRLVLVLTCQDIVLNTIACNHVKQVRTSLSYAEHLHTSLAHVPSGGNLLLLPISQNLSLPFPSSFPHPYPWPSAETINYFVLLAFTWWCQHLYVACTCLSFLLCGWYLLVTELESWSSLTCKKLEFGFGLGIGLCDIWYRHLQCLRCGRWWSKGGRVLCRRRSVTASHSHMYAVWWQRCQSMFPLVVDSLWFPIQRLRLIEENGCSLYSRA